jgi:hypothetical protein
MHEGFAGLLAVLSAAAVAIVDVLWRHPWTTAIAVAVLLLAVGWRRLWAVVARMRSRRRVRLERQAALPGELGSLLASIERHWARRGRPRPPARGLLEHLDSLPSHVLSPPEREASGKVVAACYRSAYRGELPDVGEIERLRREVARLG